MKEDYGIQLQQEMKERDIRQTDLARELGYTKTAVHKALHSGTMTRTTYDRYRTALLEIAARHPQHPKEVLPDELVINGVKYVKSKD